MTMLTGCKDDEAVEPDQNATEQDDSIVDDDEDQDDNGQEDDNEDDNSEDGNDDDNSSGEEDSSSGEDNEDDGASNGEDDPDGDGSGEDNSEDEGDGSVGEDGDDSTNGDDSGDEGGSEDEGETGNEGTDGDNGSGEDGAGEEDGEGNGSSIAEEVAALVAGTDSKIWVLEQYGMGAFTIPVEPCRADDEWIFYQDGTFVIKDNASKCDAGDPAQIGGNWSVSEDGEMIILSNNEMSQEYVIDEISASHAVFLYDGITFFFRAKAN